MTTQQLRRTSEPIHLSEKPLVSIVIPSFNQGRFIQDTIDSILNQSYRPLEIIVVDAQSTDNTLSILDKYSNVDNVSWVSEPDRGHADGVNKGFLRARGEIVAWLNSDDVYFSRDVIDTIVNTFQQKPTMDVIYGDVAIISSENFLLRLFLLPSYNLKRIQRKNLISQSAAFFRKHVVQNEKLDGNQIGLDYEYWLRLGRLKYCFHHVRKVLAGDRHYPERLSVSKSDLISSQIRDVKTKYGLSEFTTLLMHPLDRLAQAICRFEGLLLLAGMSLCYRAEQTRFAFPLQIDSLHALLWRQLVKQVGKPM
ncbi:MAG TPA: glycosyltransferase family 2 protein [Anaerolineales bacterium]|nr:glycosyltransferase family 2 protein [Anaerolineales bacterium]HLO32262.1 glycosyltransferase family 2 protein [Anaerolineales bacterium]